MARTSVWHNDVVCVMEQLPRPCGGASATSVGTCAVRLTKGVLKHIVDRHIVRPDGPWEIVAGSNALDELCAWARTPEQSIPSGSSAARFCEQFLAMLGRAMRRPQLVRDHRHSRPGRPRWIAVCREGLQVVIEERSLETMLVITAYWPLNYATTAEREPWRRVARRLLLKQSSFGKLAMVFDKTSLKSFATAETWGLRRQGQHWTWTGTFPNWQ